MTKRNMINRAAVFSYMNIVIRNTYIIKIQEPMSPLNLIKTKTFLNFLETRNAEKNLI